MPELTLDQGMGGNWFVRIDGKLIASFIDKEDAELFCKCKYPNTEILCY
jgi:hypothetical protein